MFDSAAPPPPVEDQNGAVPASPVMACCTVHMHVDADRDGTVDDTFARNRLWSTGASNTGAIICVNCDNDDGKSSTLHKDNCDNADGEINGGSDLSEIAPLDLRKVSGNSLGSHSVRLSVDTGSTNFQPYIRIFDTRAAGGIEIIGPNTGADKLFTDADFDAQHRIELGMEAIRFPFRSQTGGASFDGYITLTLTVEDGAGGTSHRETAKIRVAPWILFNHMDVTDEVYVAEQPGDNDGVFIPQLRAVLGGKLKVIPVADCGRDRWAQDVMEIGFSQWPDANNLVSVTRTAGLRSSNDLFGKYPGKRLLGPDYGYIEPNTPSVSNTLDSFGNLECSPPIPGYPFGRVIYGHGGGGVFPARPPMTDQMRALLEGQSVQSPIPLDTDWLAVGHVDEFLSFIPDQSGTHGFKIAYASAQLGVDIVRAANAVSPATPLFQGIKENNGNASGLVAPHIAIYGGHATVGAILGDPDFLAVQNTVQGSLDSNKQVLQRGLGLQPSDFIEIPALFHHYANQTNLRYIAFTPGAANMLVVTNSPSNLDLCIPKPFGPVVGGTCKFEERITAAFQSNSAANIHFIDCFNTYHVLAGEVHCGTNTKRIPPSRKWWE